MKLVPKDGILHEVNSGATPCKYLRLVDTPVGIGANAVYTGVVLTLSNQIINITPDFGYPSPVAQKLIRQTANKPKLSLFHLEKSFKILK